MNKKGFTLIELLAVLVILAIIALIATPIVLNIIDDTKQQSSLRSADFYLDALELSIAQVVLGNKNFDNKAYNVLSNGNVCLIEENNECKEELKVEVKGEVPTSGSVIIKNGKIKEASIILNHKKIVKNIQGELVYDPFENISISGVSPLTLSNSEGKNLVDYKIYGNSVQNGTPNPTNPIEIQSVGNYDDETGKYIIPIKVNGKTTNIYLNEPLRKVGDYADYIDYTSNKVVRNVKKYEFKGTENFLTTTYLNTYTYIIPGGYSNDSLNTHFNSKKMQSSRIWGECYYTGFEDRIAFGILNSPYSSVSLFQGYLKEQYTNGNPITIYYKLKKPTEETIELPTLPTFKGTTTIEVDTTIQPSNIEIIYSGKQEY